MKDGWIDSKKMTNEPGRQCEHCKFFKKQGHELCKHCAVYGHKLEYITSLKSMENPSNIGECLAVLDFSIQELMKLYLQAGLDWKQIEAEMEAIVKENTKFVAVLTDKY